MSGTRAFDPLNDTYSQKFTKNTSNPDVNLNIGPHLSKYGTRHDRTRSQKCSFRLLSTTDRYRWFSRLYKVHGSSYNIERNARASKMTSAHPQDGANAHNFEGDIRLGIGNLGIKDLARAKQSLD